MRPYQYRCHDYSVLTPVFKTWVVTPMIRFVPWAIPANIITIISNLFIYAGLYISLNQDILGVVTSRLAISFCLLAYLVGDHLDGMQAKRTGTGSALGEFCDHYLDAFNNGIVLFTTFMVFGVSDVYLIMLTMATSYLAHMVVFYEQFKTGWLTFEKVGSLEGVLLVAVMIAASAIDPVYNLFQIKLGVFTIIELFMMVSALSALITFLKTWKRIPDTSYGFWLFTGMVLVTGGIACVHFTAYQIFIILTLYASLYIGRIMRGHLVDGIERQTDLVVPVLLIISLLRIQLSIEHLFIGIIVYLTIQIALLTFQTFSALKVFWVWSNSKQKS